MKGERSGEFAWIAKHFSRLAPSGAHGLQDDAALVDLGRTIVTQDTIVEGVHFLPDDAPRDVAMKAIGVNASDIVAKGGTPFAMTVGLGVPDRWTDPDVASFAEGLDEYCDGTLAFTNRYPPIDLLGGDTTRSPERLFVSVTMFGRPGERYVSRSGARAGDAIVVCGPVGRGVLGLKGRTGELDGMPDDLLRHYASPVPDFAAARAVAAHANAAMDVSDGLVGDLAKLCAASNVRGVIDLSDIPVPPSARPLLDDHPELLTEMATGGDDYVVLMTLHPAARAAVSAMGVDASVIGHIVAGSGVSVSLDGVPLELDRTSYTHD